MLPSICFDDQAMFEADKIYDVRSNLLLSAKLEAMQAATTKVSPQSTLRVRR